MGLIISIIIGFGTSLLCASILYWLDRYEKEPILLLGGVFFWGAVVAAGSSFIINTTLGISIFSVTGSDAATEMATGSIIAPIVEETLKGLAVLIVFLLFRREFDSVLDGIIYAGIAALGFAATENAYYIYSYGFTESGWGGLAFMTFVRIILVGWQHPFYTAFIGIGLALARLNRNWFVKITAPLLGLGMAMFTHAFHNTLASFLTGAGGMAVGALVDWSGWLFMLVIIIWATRSEGKILQKFLSGEVQVGTISVAHFHTASSPWRQMGARLTALFNGKYGKTARFYQLCGEYAHKRQQYASLGDEGGNLAILHNLRAELAAVALYAQV
jgi:RsiW-degrading membrane proteinase PrsW (M82 family)